MASVPTFGAGEQLVEDEVTHAEAAFAADLSAPRLARAWLADQLAQADLAPSQHETALLLVSELVTNVIVHTEAPPVVTLSVSPGQVRIGVCDDGGGDIEVRAPSDGVGGWGLRFVEQMASSWGIRAEGPDKELWFTIERDAPGSGGSGVTGDPGDLASS